ncbi:MAG TPA: phosphoribosylamine--glycine ligase [Actinomycetota bacterium]|nr:phosphoribosylamine--glycine ligase [Actinomycetota bacterium]
MRILVVGGGGREHALAWKLAENPTVDKMFAAPGNAGIAEIAECFQADPTDAETMANLAEDLGIDLTVIGPEGPLVAGLADELASRGLPVFGPTKAAARIEGSKAWAKEVMAKAGVPTARSKNFTEIGGATEYLDDLAPPYVVKADGLASGKGVYICADKDEAARALEECLVSARFGAAGSTVVVEEFLEGEELSLFCLTDGRTVLPLVPAQDFKRAYDNDEGPNTGGMGAYSPVPHMPEDVVERAVREIFEPVVRQLEREGARFQGLLYGGLMVTADGPKVLEFNCRFGDPEAQVVLPRLESDLAEPMLACAEGNLAPYAPRWRTSACVTVVLASGGYPGEYETGKEIKGLTEAASMSNVFLFHAGTRRRRKLVTAGGRVLAVSALGADLAQARARAYDAVEAIDFKGKQFRTDIALRASEMEGKA